MKQLYHHKEVTPLNFHRFFWYFSLPLGFLIIIGKMVNEISEMVSFNWLYAADIGFFIILLTLRLVCFIGFFKRKSYAWYGVMIFLCVGILNSVYVLIAYAIYSPDQIGTVAAQAAILLIYSILVGIYYNKRRALFFPHVDRASASNVQEALNSVEVNKTSCEVLPQAKYCRECGYELSDNSVFCSRCGTKVVKE
jgi:hypothetical protein